jgi:hypothetical protein
MNILGKLNGWKTYLVALAGIGWAVIGGDASGLEAKLHELVPWVVMAIMRLVTLLTTQAK